MIFIPKEGEVFWYIEDTGNITNDIRRKFIAHRIKSGNCYRTEEDAVRARDKSYAKRELEVLAYELNGRKPEMGEVIEKTYINYSHYSKEFGNYYSGVLLSICEISSVSPNFLEVALEKLGEEKLRLILEVE